MSPAPRPARADSVEQAARDLGRDVVANAATAPLPPNVLPLVDAWHEHLAEAGDVR